MANFFNSFYSTNYTHIEAKIGSSSIAGTLSTLCQIAAQNTYNTNYTESYSNTIPSGTGENFNNKIFTNVKDNGVPRFKNNFYIAVRKITPTNTSNNDILNTVKDPDHLKLCVPYSRIIPKFYSSDNINLSYYPENNKEKSYSGYSTITNGTSTYYYPHILIDIQKDFNSNAGFDDNITIKSNCFTKHTNTYFGATYSNILGRYIDVVGTPDLKGKGAGETLTNSEITAKLSPIPLLVIKSIEVNVKLVGSSNYPYSMQKICENYATTTDNINYKFVFTQKENYFSSNLDSSIYARGATINNWDNSNVGSYIFNTKNTYLVNATISGSTKVVYKNKTSNAYDSGSALYFSFTEALQKLLDKLGTPSSFDLNDNYFYSQSNNTASIHGDFALCYITSGPRICYFAGQNYFTNINFSRYLQQYIDGNNPTNNVYLGIQTKYMDDTSAIYVDSININVAPNTYCFNTSIYTSLIGCNVTNVTSELLYSDNKYYLWSDNSFTARQLPIYLNDNSITAISSLDTFSTTKYTLEPDLTFFNKRIIFYKPN